MNTILQVVHLIPNFIWVFLGIYLVFKVGAMVSDDRVWGYEVEFPLKQNVGRAEVEIKEWKKQGKIIELGLKPVDDFSFEDARIIINGYEVFSATNSEFNERNKCEKEYTHGEPKEGAEVKVLLDSKEIFCGVLLID